MRHVLKTERLLLQKMQEEDASALFTIWTDPDVAKYMNIEPFQEVEQALHMIRFINDTSSALRYTIWHDGIIIGSAGYNHMEQITGIVEIGYDLAKHVWRQGFGTEIVRALLEEAMQNGYSVVEATIVPQNEGSIKLVEKLDFTYSDTIEEDGQQLALYTKKLP